VFKGSVDGTKFTYEFTSDPETLPEDVGVTEGGGFRAPDSSFI